MSGPLAVVIRIRNGFNYRNRAGTADPQQNSVGAHGIARYAIRLLLLSWTTPYVDRAKTTAIVRSALFVPELFSSFGETKKTAPFTMCPLRNCFHCYYSHVKNFTFRTLEHDNKKKHFDTDDGAVTFLDEAPLNDFLNTSVST